MHMLTLRSFVYFCPERRFTLYHGMLAYMLAYILRLGLQSGLMELCIVLCSSTAVGSGDGNIPHERPVLNRQKPKLTALLKSTAKLQH